MNLNRQPSRAQAVRGRWCRITLQMLAITPGVLVLAHWQQAHIAKIDQIPPWYLAGFLVSVAALALLVGIRKLVGFFAPYRSACWPSSWLSIAGAVGVSMVAISSIDFLKVDFAVLNSSTIDFARTGLLLILISAAFPIWGAVLLLRERRAIHTAADRSEQPDGVVKVGGKRISDLNLAALRLWVRSDAPITSQETDLFGHIEIASRVATRLAQKNAAAQSILGSLGIGKSSLRSLVSEELKHRHERHTRLVPVSLWSFSNPLAAVEGVVNEIAQALERYVSAFALRRIAAKYGEAISGAGTSPKIVLGLFSPQRSPWSVLAEINTIALSIGLHLVVWVEDLERFASNDSEASIDVETKLSPLRSLLHALEQLSSFTIVSATTSLLYRFDVDKISHYVERIPDLSRRDVKAILGRFRDSWKSFDYLDPENHLVRESFWKSSELAPPFSVLLDNAKSIHIYSNAVADICPSPRLLKRIIRRCDEAWSNLCGEVDLDELIAIVSLREASPKAFALLEQQVSDIQSLEKQRRQEALVALFGRIDAQVSEEIERAAVKFLIQFLFGRETRVQGIAKNNHADYWTRIITQNPTPTGCSDQGVLHALLSDDDKVIVSMLDESNSGRVVFDLSAIMSTHRCIHLLPLVCSASKNNENFSLLDNPSAIAWLSFILREKSKQEDIDSPLIEAIRASAADIIVSKPSAFMELVLMYATDSDEAVPSGPLTPQGIRRAQDLLCEIWMSAYAHAPERLSRFLAQLPDGGFKILVGSTFNGRRGILYSLRHELTSTIVRSIACAPQHVLPQIASIVVTKLPLEDKWTYLPKEADEIFGDSAAFLLSIPESICSEHFADSRSWPLLVAAEKLRAQQRFVSTLYEIFDHPEVEPGVPSAKI